VPFWFISLLVFFPNSPICVVFGILPFSAPVLMMLCLGITGVPAWQLAASMVVLVASVLGELWIAAKLFRIYLPMYGKRPRIREIVRALRAGKVNAVGRERRDEAFSREHAPTTMPPPSGSVGGSSTI
jgi:ABC-2 type transport system permease protein